MKKILFTIFFVTLAQTVVWAAEPTIFGDWVRSVKVNDELTLHMRLNVTATHSTFGMTCVVNGHKGDVEVKIATKVDGWNFELLEEGYASKDVGDFDCHLNFSPSVWTYDLMGDQIKLVTNLGELLFMNRPKK